MQLNKQEVILNRKKIEAELLEETNYANQLFAIIAFPERCEMDNRMDHTEESGESKQIAGKTVVKTSRAASLTELQKRLEKIQQSRHKLSYKEKLMKKSLKSRMKKKVKQELRKGIKGNLNKSNLVENGNKNEETDIKAGPAKPVYNSEGKMVFSKFDFSGLGKEKKEKKKEKDPKKLLENLQKQKEKLAKLEAEGETAKAQQIKEKTGWRNAIAKAEGEKVKDDAELLKKTLKKDEQKKRKSKKKWEQRIEGVKNAKEERQSKRQENIDKRKKEVKNKKLKKAAKKGKIIPGF